MCDPVMSLRALLVLIDAAAHGAPEPFPPLYLFVGGSEAIRVRVHEAELVKPAAALRPSGECDRGMGSRPPSLHGSPAFRWRVA